MRCIYSRGSQAQQSLIPGVTQATTSIDVTGILTSSRSTVSASTVGTKRVRVMILPLACTVALRAIGRQGAG